MKIEKKVWRWFKIRGPAREWWFILKFYFWERHLRKNYQEEATIICFAACSCCHGPRGKINQTEDSSSVRSAVSHHSALCHYNIKKVKKRKFQLKSARRPPVKSEILYGREKRARIRFSFPFVTLMWVFCVARISKCTSVDAVGLWLRRCKKGVLNWTLFLWELVDLGCNQLLHFQQIPPAACSR